jgi:hypothetical protein
MEVDISELRVYSGPTKVNLPAVESTIRKVAAFSVFRVDYKHVPSQSNEEVRFSSCESRDNLHEPTVKHQTCLCNSMILAAVFHTYPISK